MTYIHPSERLHQSVHGKTLSDVRIGFLYFLPDSLFCACNDKLEPTNSLAPVTKIIKEIWYWWYHDPITTSTAQAHPNIEFIK